MVKALSIIPIIMAIGCSLTAPRAPELTRCDSDFDLAAGQCEVLWQSYGWQLHETPENDQATGIACVFARSEHSEDCSDIGGRWSTGLQGEALCVVELSYASVRRPGCADGTPTM